MNCTHLKTPELGKLRYNNEVKKTIGEKSKENLGSLAFFLAAPFLLFPFNQNKRNQKEPKKEKEVKNEI